MTFLSLFSHLLKNHLLLNWCLEQIVRKIRGFHLMGQIWNFHFLIFPILNLWTSLTMSMEVLNDVKCEFSSFKRCLHLRQRSPNACEYSLQKHYVYRMQGNFRRSLLRLFKTCWKFDRHHFMPVHWKQRKFNTK